MVTWVFAAPIDQKHPRWKEAQAVSRFFADQEKLRSSIAEHVDLKAFNPWIGIKEDNQDS